LQRFHNLSTIAHRTIVSGGVFGYLPYGHNRIDLRRADADRRHGLASVIGAVVPAYNREDNLRLLLMSLELQSSTDFHVVVADDGSTDRTAKLIAEMAGRPAWHGRLTRVSCGPHQGVRTGRARNIGAANVDPSTRLLLMLDTDLVLQPDAIAMFAAAHSHHPSQVLFGAVDWLPPMDRYEVADLVYAGRIDELRRQVPAPPSTRIEGTFAGPELRADLFRFPDGEPVPLGPQWALPLNSAWPLDLYWAVGGFDETMTGYGYQDMELGARAAAAGAICVPCPELWSLHVWHPKPARAMEENQRNLDRYLRRRGPNGVSEVDIDWSLWFHYHKERGGSVARSAEGLCAVSGDRRHRIALPDDHWLERLGHCAHVDSELPAAELAGMVNHGFAELRQSCWGPRREPRDHRREPSSGRV
jgi:glycosyltransferase involved in cell wall biosynthesis